MRLSHIDNAFQSFFEDNLDSFAADQTIRYVLHIIVVEVNQLLVYFAENIYV